MNVPLPRSEEKYFKSRINHLDLSSLYKYSNKKIIEVLDIQDDEQKHLRIIISRSEKYIYNNKRRRNNTRKNVRDQKISTLKNGISNRQIAK